MTPQTPSGRFGKALSKVSSAPTSAEGLMRQQLSREIVASVPVSSESEAVGLGHNGQEPMQISALWYLNVHAPPPFEWLRTQAVLYPNVLILKWIAPTGGRGVVTLDLVTARKFAVRCRRRTRLVVMMWEVWPLGCRVPSWRGLCALFQLLYPNGVERLGTDTARERVRWVGAIWEVLASISRAPMRAITERSESEAGLLQRSSSVRSHSSEGSAATTFMPPTGDIPNTASVLSRNSSFITQSTYFPRQTADDMSVASLDPPSRASSLRRTTSMANLELEADIEPTSAHSAGTPAPVTVTSGASQGESSMLSPPPARSRNSYAESDGNGYLTLSATDRPRSPFYSVSRLTSHDKTSYVPADTEQSTIRGIRIVADSLSQGTRSHDALSTGYGSG